MIPVHIPNKGRSRRGFTILEIVLSIAILAFVFSAVGTILNTGSQAAVRSKLLTEATMRADATLAEIIAGVHQKESVSQMPFEDAPQTWFWSLDVTEGPHIDLLNLRITVSHKRPDDEIDVKFQLDRWVRVDEVFLEAETSSSSSSSNSTVTYE